jgi:hypothetical protein
LSNAATGCGRLRLWFLSNAATGCERLRLWFLSNAATGCGRLEPGRDARTTARSVKI